MIITVPKFTDLHTHLREPGQNHKETVETATQAAIAGGFGTLVAMPNTIPPMDTAERWMAFNEECRKRTPLEIIQTACISVGRAGRELTDFAALKEAGVIALSDDGSTPQDDDLMLEAGRQAAKLGLPIIDHCEDMSLSKPGVMHRGQVSERLGLHGQPREAEERIVRRDIAIAAKTGCHFHLQHLSSAGSVKLLAEARKAGIPVTGEVTPHHLAFTHDAVAIFGPNAKMAPPLREESDKNSLIQAVFDGTITCIATDHAPHTSEEKAKGMVDAPFGIIGLEYAFQICHEILCVKNGLAVESLVDLLTRNPREIIGLPMNTDTVEIEIGPEKIINIANGKSKSHNCPYDGFAVHSSIIFNA